MDKDRDELKITSLLSEYREIRIESRTVLILEMICIFLSVLLFAVLLTIAIESTQYILIFISPVLSLLFIILGMGLVSYAINLGLRATRIERELKTILGEATIQWESSIGIFAGLEQQTNIWSARAGKQWLIISVLAIAIGVSPVIFALSYWYNPVHERFGSWALAIIGIDIFAGMSTLVIGYRLVLTSAWRK